MSYNGNSSSSSMRRLLGMRSPICTMVLGEAYNMSLGFSALTPFLYQPKHSFSFLIVLGHNFMAQSIAVIFGKEYGVGRMLTFVKRFWGARLNVSNGLSIYFTTYLVLFSCPVLPNKFNSIPFLRSRLAVAEEISLNTFM